jgi:hypothetical protein
MRKLLFLQSQMVANVHGDVGILEQLLDCNGVVEPHVRNVPDYEFISCYCLV